MPKPRQTPKPVAGPPPGLMVANIYTLPNKVTLETGDKCKVKGELGTFKFQRHVINTNLRPHSEWIDLWGGRTGYEQYRSVKVDRIKHIPEKRTRKRKAPQSN